MKKVTAPIGNNFCPQCLFLYGTYREDGTPNFGQFCWLTYYWTAEHTLGVIASLGEKKLTMDLIRKNKVFSANLVTEAILPMSDYLGCVSGYDKDKMNAPIQVEKGQVLDVPTLADSPVTMELQVDSSICIGEGEIYLCKVVNVTADEELLGDALTLEEKLRRVAPVEYTCGTYFGWNGNLIAPAGEPRNGFKK